MAKKINNPSSLYQIKITLAGSKPPIWRRIIVKDNIRMDALHEVLQIAMGWKNYHLHHYRIGRGLIGIPDPNFDMDILDERKINLNSIVSRPKDSLVYEYDFGDRWEHKIILEEVHPLNFSESPRVIKGKKACPPEDCGGIWGYYDLLDQIQNPKHKEHKAALDWVGGDFYPDEFDMNAINEHLKMLNL